MFALGRASRAYGFTIYAQDDFAVVDGRFCCAVQTPPRTNGEPMKDQLDPEADAASEKSCCEKTKWLQRLALAD